MKASIQYSVRPRIQAQIKADRIKEARRDSLTRFTYLVCLAGAVYLIALLYTI